MCDRPRCPEDLLDLLEQLRESWSAGGSTSIVPPTLSNLLDKTIAAQPQQQHGRDESDSNSDEVARLSVLADITRFALTSTNGPAAAGARCRALALDCLACGVRHLPNAVIGDVNIESEVLAIAELGARDERWNVRVAAARVAGRALGKGGGEGRGRELSRLLLSKQGCCWLPALLVDGYPEVEEAARAALTSAQAEPTHPALEATPASNRPPPAAEDHSAAAAGSAVIRCVRDVLRFAAASAAKEAVGNRDRRVIDVEAEAAERTALRALRGGVSLLVPPSRLGWGARFASPEEREAGRAARVEALGTVEDWLASSLVAPPAKVPWGEGTRSVAESTGSPGGILSAEARDAVRALLGHGEGGGDVQSAGVEAAVELVEKFREECFMASGEESRRQAGEGEVEGEGEDQDEEKFWRRAYCGLLVRLEVLFVAAGRSGVPPKSSTPSKASPAPEETTSSSSPNAALAAERSPDRSSSMSRRNGITEVASDGGDTPSGVVPLGIARLAGKIAEALEEVPLAFEQAVPANLDDDLKISVADKKSLRVRGDRRRRWLVSSTHLLLRAGTRFCERHRHRVIGAGCSGDEDDERNDEAVMVKLLAAALPFQQASTRADDPTKAWLSCVAPDALDPPAKSPPRVQSMPDPAGPAAALTTPISWESCLRGQTLPTRELPAPWAANPLTVQVAAALVEAAWEALSLSGSGPAAERSAEALLATLRAAARARKEAGVGLKHACAAAIRKLRFPLVAGSVLGHALPLALPLADHHNLSHQAVGLSLVSHLVAEAVPAELAWHSGLLLEVVEAGLRGGARDPAISLLRMATAVRLLRRAPAGGGGVGSGDAATRAGVRIAREALAQAGRATDGEVRVVMVCGAGAVLELPASRGGYAPCEVLRPGLLCLLPILQSTAFSARLDARAAALRTLTTLCTSCWPRVHAHASKLLCALLWTCGDCRRRELGRDGAAPLGLTDFTSHATVSAAADEVVLEHAVRLGALVLLLGGDVARATLREVCEAVAALRPSGSDMVELAGRALPGGAG